MADNLPLIPNKQGGCAGDVRPVLRGSFRERTAVLPPLSGSRRGAGGAEGGRRDELQLRALAARRLVVPAATSPRYHTPLLSRDHLMPGLQLNAAREAGLWVRKVLARRSSQTEEEASPCRMSSPLPPSPETITSLPSLAPKSQCRSAQTMSIGEVVVRPTPPPSSPPAHTPLPEYIVCIPAQIDFVNFTLGHLHTMSIRLVNVSPLEVRLSLRPPARRELSLQLCGRLTVTSGAACELRVHFRPSDVRALHDEILVRVSVGRGFIVPIACYMQPPLLDVLVPNPTMSALSCARDAGGAGDGAGCGGGEVIDLGARLLGDTHSAPLLLRCDTRHAVFFALTEDSWYAQTVTEITSGGALCSGGFTWSPAVWRGGGAVRGAVWCRAPHSGLHELALRVLSSTAVARPLHVLADALYFHPDHITIEAQEKDYDICSDDDPACDYYLNLGTAFPSRGLASSFSMFNHSPVTYSYYWSVRAWGVCTCWEEEASEWMESEDDPDQLCGGAQSARSHPSHVRSDGDADALRVEPNSGHIAPRASVTLHVAVPDVGPNLGVHRAVLVLILKEIPRKSFPCGFVPMLVSSSFVPSEYVPGQKTAEREVCEVVCRQLEVWWRVAPLRFVLEPPLIQLPHSRRMKQVTLKLHATQLFLGGVIRVHRSDADTSADSTFPLLLQPHQPVHFDVTLPLPVLPNDYPMSHFIQVESERGDWSSRMEVEQRSRTRHPTLLPPVTWLGVVPHGAALSADLQLHNDTHQHIFWWADVFRWIGENPPKEVCLSRAACDVCWERQCTCALLRPARGSLPAGQTEVLQYRVNAPERDGMVVTLVRVRRTAGDVSRIPSGVGAAARGALLVYRVLAPKLVLKVLPCRCQDTECKECSQKASSSRSEFVLRPSRALVVGRAVCYWLLVYNTTPLPTHVNWQPSPEVEDSLRIRFFPNEFDIKGYQKLEIKVVLESLAVSGRRVWCRRAAVRHTPQPLYLLVDACIAGVEIECWLPLEGEQLCIRRKQRELFWWSLGLPQTAEAAFAWDDARRALHQANCPCKTEMSWVPPSHPPSSQDIPIVSTPPELTMTCSCWRHAAVCVPVRAAPVLQFRALPIHTVRCLRIQLRSVCVVTTRWSAALRHGALKPKRTLRTADEEWRAKVRECGVCLTASGGGVLGPTATADLLLRVYADCWGLYRDRLLIMMEHLSPLVVDVYVEAVGCPLQWATRPAVSAVTASCPDSYADKPPVVWMSKEQPVRSVRARNTSRAALIIHAYTLRDHEHAQDPYPFRLYMRMSDILPRVCPCCDMRYESEDSSIRDEVLEEGSVEMDTDFELYLGPDYGVQDDTQLTVEPEECEVAAGATVEWRVGLRGEETIQPHTMLLRIRPIEKQGPDWFRPEPPPAVVHVKMSQRVGELQLSHNEVVVRLCALMLPFNDVMRVRKRILVRNVGNGKMFVNVSTGEEECVCMKTVCGEKVPVEWRLVEGEEGERCGRGCGGRERGERKKQTTLELPARCSTELCVEVEICTADVWPPVVEEPVGDPGLGPATVPSVGSNPGDIASYDTFMKFIKEMQFFDDINLLQTVPLVVELEIPAIKVEPKIVDFDYVCDGDTRKTYLTVSHTSRTESLDIWINWEGDAEFRFHPLHLFIVPGETERVYVQYTAKWTGAVSCGTLEMRTGGAAGGWCQRRVAVRGRGSRDYNCHAPPHDFTDDTRLLPPQLLLDGSRKPKDKKPDAH